MALSRKMDHSVNAIFLEKGVHPVEITDIRLDENIVLFILNVLEIRQITCIGQCIHIYDAVCRILPDKKSDHMAADEAGTSGHNDVSFKSFHIYKAFSSICLRQNASESFQ